VEQINQSINPPASLSLFLFSLFLRASNHPRRISGFTNPSSVRQRGGSREREREERARNNKRSKRWQRKGEREREDHDERWPGHDDDGDKGRISVPITSSPSLPSYRDEFVTIRMGFPEVWPGLVCFGFWLLAFGIGEKARAQSAIDVLSSWIVCVCVCVCVCV
jgi:hypothetical protein